MPFESWPSYEADNSQEHARISEPKTPEQQLAELKRQAENLGITPEAQERSEITSEAHASLEGLWAEQEMIANIQEQCAGLNEGYDVFCNFISSELTEQELQWLNGVVDDARQFRRIKGNIQENGYPSDRIAFNSFADDFGIQTNVERTDERDDVAKDVFFSALPKYRAFQDVLEVKVLTDKIANLQQLNWSEALEQIQDINTYLIWPDGKSWELDNILEALIKKDEENAQAGQPTQYFESFVRTTRSFSPEIANRIDAFIDAREYGVPEDREPANPVLRTYIEGGLPEGADAYKADNNGTFTAEMSDGTQVTINQDGKHLTRTLEHGEGGMTMTTPMERVDIMEASQELEWVRQEAIPKLKRTEYAISFLENPKFADVPLADLHEVLLKILGHELFNELGVREATDKGALIQTLRNNAGMYKKQLEDAKLAFEKKRQKAVNRNRAQYAEHDRSRIHTLKTTDKLGFNKIGFDWIAKEVQAGVLLLNIWKFIDPQNYDPANSHIFESGAESGNEHAHLENLYRMMNVILTKSPDGMVDGKLVWFSLDPAKLISDGATKTESEVTHLLKQAGVWSEGIGVDKDEVRRRLRGEENIS